MQSINLGIVGGGNMASALIRGLLGSKSLGTQQIRVSDKLEAQLQALNREYGIETAKDNRTISQWADVVLIAVKPQVVPAVLPELKDTYRKEQLFISIAAGVPIASFAAVLPAGARVIRAMPNTPALVQQAATALARGAHANDDDLELACHVFRAVGTPVVLEESQLDAVTGLSGSGPAYVMLMIEALADGAVNMGLSRQVALTLATQTLYGSAKLLLESGEHPAVLKDRVASPGGTTIAGLRALEQHGLRHALIEAVAAATERSRCLGRG